MKRILYVGLVFTLIFSFHAYAEFEQKLTYEELLQKYEELLQKVESLESALNNNSNFYLASASETDIQVEINLDSPLSVMSVTIGMTDDLRATTFILFKNTSELAIENLSVSAELFSGDYLMTNLSSKDCRVTEGIVKPGELVVAGYWILEGRQNIVESVDKIVISVSGKNANMENWRDIRADLTIRPNHYEIGMPYYTLSVHNATDKPIDRLNAILGIVNSDGKLVGVSTDRVVSNVALLPSQTRTTDTWFLDSQTINSEMSNELFGIVNVW